MRTPWLLTPLTLFLACGPADPGELDEAAGPVSAPSPSASPLPSPAPTVPRRIACSHAGSLHLRPDGRVALYGGWPPSWETGIHGAAVRGLVDVVAVAAGGRDGLLLTQSGLVYRVGPGRAAQRVGGLPLAASIHGTEDGSAVLGRDGSVWVWGDLPVRANDFNLYSTPTQVTGIPPFVELSVATTGVMLGRDANGAVWVVNHRNRGPWADTWPALAPHIKAGLPGVRQLHATIARAYVVTTDGRLMSWSSETAGDPRATPRVELQLAAGDRVVSSSRGVTVLFRGGSVLDDSGAVPSGVQGVADVGSCDGAVLLEDTLGRVMVYGTHPTLGWSPVVGAELLPLDGAAAGDSHTYFLRDGVVRAAGINDRGQLGLSGLARSTTPVPLSLCGGAPVLNVASGSDHGLAVCASGEVWSWGANEWGQLGHGFTSWAEPPAPVLWIPRAVDVRAGFGQSFVVLADRTVMAFGRNVDGQLGLGWPHLFVPAPAAITAVRGVVDVAVGDQHTLWLTQGGRVWVAGSGARGQLGIANLASTRVAQLLPAPSGVVSIAAMQHTSLAVSVAVATRTTWVWGADTDRVFGSGPTLATPTAYAGVAAAFAVDGGPRNGAVLGESWQALFGAGERGQIRSFPGAPLEQRPPVASRVVFGDAHRIDLADDGFTVAGANESGQLGLGHDLDTPWGRPSL